MSSGKNVQDWRERTKLALVKACGGKCNKCGYDKCIASIDFHHLRDKKFQIAQALCKPKNIQAIIEEVKKCILLCRNCHGEYHYNMWSLDEIELIKFDNDIYLQHIESTYKICICGNKWRPNSAHRKYCSNQCLSLKRIPKIKFIDSKRLKECEYCHGDFPYKVGKDFCSHTCYDLYKRKVVWPSKEELEKLVWEKPTTYIAKSLGVSDSAIVKWCKVYKIKKPPRGYWSKIKSDKLKQ